MVKNKEKKSLVGIIGFGRFGKVLAYILKSEFKIIVYSKPKPKDFPLDSRINLGSLKEVADCKIVILAVPISSIAQAVKKISPYLKKGSLVVDVCSVKKYPVEIMKKLLPKNINILATHPLFGPDSFKKSPEGLNIVTSPIKIKKTKYNQIKKWIRKKGLNIIEISPDEHDRLAAKTQVITHLIGRILEEMKINKTLIDTSSFKKLLEIKEIICKDSWQLFQDIQRFNPYAKKMRQDFKKALQKIEKMIEGSRN